LGLVLVGIVAVLVVEVGTPQRASRIHSRRPHLAWLLAMPALGVVAFLTAQPLYAHVMPPAPSVGAAMAELAKVPLGAVIVLLTVAVYGPLVEEFAFRGHAQDTLEEAWGPVPAIVVTALLFSMMHFSVWALPYHFFTGLLFGAAAWAARSVWAPVALHAATNGANQLLELGTGRAPKVVQSFLDLPLGAFALLFVASLSAMLGLGWWLVTERRREVTTR
jgi:membrane protease YdiL (CAAX protease family)